MISNVDVLQKLYCYLSGRIDLQSFRDWLVGAQLEREDGVEDDAKRLLSEIEGRYAEFSDRLISESSWKKYIEVLLRPESGTQSPASILVFVPPPAPSAHVSWNPSPAANGIPNRQMQPV